MVSRVIVVLYCIVLIPRYGHRMDNRATIEYLR